MECEKRREGRRREANVQVGTAHTGLRVLGLEEEEEEQRRSLVEAPCCTRCLEQTYSW